jgi:hypothetical protein
VHAVTKARCLGAGFLTSSWSASANRSGSRLAAGIEIVTISPPGSSGPGARRLPARCGPPQLGNAETAQQLVDRSRHQRRVLPEQGELIGPGEEQFHLLAKHQDQVALIKPNSMWKPL